MHDANTTVCRFCSNTLAHVFADLGVTPLSNSYIKPDNANVAEPFFPLRAWVCSQCWLVQLEEFESPEDIFGDYAYFSSYSSGWVAHAERYAEAMIKRLSLDEQSLVTELASNDGYLLKHFVRRGIPVQGIEPAANVARVSQDEGIPTLVDFFGEKLARKLAGEGRRADLIAANNVLAHVPDLNDFVAGIEVLLKPEGVATLEFPDLRRLMRENQFDTIYHEHFSYFSFSTVERVFGRAGLVIFDVEHLSTHGGSLRIFAARAGSDTARHATAAVAQARQFDESDGLYQLETYLGFAERVRATKRALLALLGELKQAGAHIAAYGAAAKGNTLLNYCGVGTDYIDYVVDRNPVKQGNLLPGSRVPIYPVETLESQKPDYLLILPWNLSDEIIAQTSDFQSAGGRYIVPIPEPRIV